MSTSDEAPRLVEADALLAKGDLQGELIVVQCELERGGYSRERGIVLRKREHELLEKHADTWANLEGLATSWTFRRGVVDDITIDVTRFLANEDEIWRRAPYLRWVRLTGVSYDSAVDNLGDAVFEWDKVRPTLERVLASGRVRYLATIDARVVWMEDSTMMRIRVSGSLSDAIAKWLCDDPTLIGRLQGLSLDRIGTTTIERLLRTEAASGLEELELDGKIASHDATYRPSTTLRPRRARWYETTATIDAERVALPELYASKVTSQLTSLETLKLEPILEHAWAASLRSLRISPGFDRTVFQALAASPLLAKLEQLNLDLTPGRTSHVPIDPLFTPEHLDSLRTLRFGVGITIERAKTLLTSPLAARLERIDLRASKLEAHREELRALWDGLLLV